MANTGTMTITASNNGPIADPAAIIKDDLTVGLGSHLTLPASFAVTYTGGASGPATVTLAALAAGLAANIPVGGTAVISLPFTTASVVTNGPNTATIATSLPDGDSNLANNTSTITASISQLMADLGIVKTVSPASAAPGDNVTFTLTVTNNGPDAADGMTINDTLPAGFTGTAPAFTYTGGAGGGSGAFPNLAVATFPSGATAVVTVTGSFPTAGTFNNTATVAPPPSVVDPVPGNNSSTTSVTVVAPPQIADLQIVKTVDPNTPVPFTQNGPAQYNLTITNNGPLAVTGAVIKDFVNAPAQFDTFPNLIFYTGGGSGPAQVFAADLLNGFAINLPVGATATVSQITLRWLNVGTFTNTSTVTPPAGITDPTPANNTSSVTAPVVAGPPPPPADGFGCPLPVSSPQYNAVSIPGVLSIIPAQPLGTWHFGQTQAITENNVLGPDCSEVANGAGFQVSIPTSNGNYVEHVATSGAANNFSYTPPTLAELTAQGFGTPTGTIEVLYQVCIHCTDGGEGPASHTYTIPYVL